MGVLSFVEKATGGLRFFSGLSGRHRGTKNLETKRRRDAFHSGFGHFLFGTRWGSPWELCCHHFII